MPKLKMKFWKHAKLKFKDLKQHGFVLTQKQVVQTIIAPEKIISDYRPNRMIAEKAISQTHKLRVVFQKTAHQIEIITFYPTRRSRYENEI